MSARKTKAQSRAEDRILQITSGVGRQSSRLNQSGVSDVYRRLLSEASDPSRLEERPVKRRRVGGGTRPHAGAEDRQASPVDQSQATKSIPQIVIDSDDSEESDFEWVETGIATDSAKSPAGEETNIGDVSIEVTDSHTTPKKTKRKGITAADRTLALAVHQAHYLFLLFHAHIRNAWCNAAPVESQLRGVLSAKIIKLLHPDPAWVQLRQSDSFLEGLRTAVDVWNAKFKVRTSGLCKARWSDSLEELGELCSKIQDETEVLDKQAFTKAAKTLQGSQDLGNQLFCALLRAVGVEARLVCSLQVLPMTNTGQAQKTSTPRSQKQMRTRIYATFESEQETTSTDEDTAKAGVASNGKKSTMRSLPSDGSRRRLGQPSFGAPVGGYNFVPEADKKKKKFRKLDYPIFWVEALNPAYQRWVAVDAVVTSSVGKASKLEPPASYGTNAMAYVIAFEEDGHAKDVTRRYVKAFNAKTRKLRVESAAHGQKWLNKAMKCFTRQGITDRDQIEEGEMTKKEAQEGLPNNIQDFKDHPQYALERHLKRNEVIWPRREVGKINAGKASSSNLEPIFRRIDVQIVQSADKWYRSGRDIKQKEQPMKHVPARSRRAQSPTESDGQDAETTALYAYSQTEPFIPPPVFRGRIPKNIYGNIDVYVPSMVPSGGVHIKHPLAKKAAQLLAIDFADAVTGFQFKGRQGTAIIQGVVVALESMDAVQTVVKGFENTMQQEEDDQRSFECLRLWRRFLLGLQIAERIGLTDIYAANDERAKELRDELDEADEAQVEHENVVEAGGFFPDSGADVVVQPTNPIPQSLEASSSQPNSRLKPTKRRLVVDDDEDDEDMIPNVGIGRDQDRSEPDSLRIHGALPMEITENARSHSPVYVDQIFPDVDDFGGGFLPAEEEVPAEGTSEAIPEIQRPTSMDMYDPEETDGQENRTKAMPEELEPPRSQQSGLIGSGSDKDEHGSLLSHDPEDEDADPEWLELD
ncbi:hypothetical protein ANO11243_079640 [Dothideomycetidae sp. 11243]|nr:hypothetical protein ANO11243_079640 [fungal sp. No.11243]